MMPEVSSKLNVKDLQRMCQPGQEQTFHKTTDIYQLSLPYNKIMMTSAILGHGFPVPITEEMTQILYHYAVNPIQILP